jgi:hypothetical protein
MFSHFSPCSAFFCLLRLPACSIPNTALEPRYYISLQVRLHPSGPPVFFHLARVFRIQPARLRPSRRRRNQHTDLYCRERSRNPVASGTLFRVCRVRKRPTDIEFSWPLLWPGVDGCGSLTGRNGPWLNLHTSTRRPFESRLLLLRICRPMRGSVYCGCSRPYVDSRRNFLTVCEWNPLVNTIEKPYRNRPHGHTVWEKVRYDWLDLSDW